MAFSVVMNVVMLVLCGIGIAASAVSQDWNTLAWIIVAMLAHMELLVRRLTQ
jgi:hypothetical protein